MRLLLAALLVFSASSARAQFNPNGFIDTYAWMQVGPLLHDYGAAPPPEVMKQRWMAPHDVVDPSFSPRVGQEFEVDFSVSPATSFDYGGLARHPTFVTQFQLRRALGIPDMPRPEGGEKVGFAEQTRHLNTNLDGLEGFSPIPLNNTLYIAYTFVENAGVGRAFDLCTASDDSIQVWINDACVLNKSVGRGVGAPRTCQERTRVMLPRGMSKITVLVWQGAGEHGFRLGFVDPPSGERLTDGNLIGIRFPGPGESGDLEGQRQFFLDREILGRSGVGCFTGDGGVRVRLRGRGVGDPAARVTVVERLDSDGPVRISNLSNGGVYDARAGTITWNLRRRDVVSGLTYDLRKTDGGQVLFDGEVEREAITQGDDAVSFLASTGPVGDFEDALDIGSPETVGRTTYSSSTDTYRVSGGGLDIWDGGDQMQLAYQTVRGDFRATARLRDVELAGDVGRWGRAGIMARYTCDANSKYSMACVPYRGEDPNVGGGNPVPGQDPARHQSRQGHLVNGTTRSQQVAPVELTREMGGGTGKLLGWARLSRRGNYFFSEFAPDEGGEPGEWVFVGGDTHIDPPSTVLVGLVASAHSSAGREALTAVYDNWSVEPVSWPERPPADIGEVVPRSRALPDMVPEPPNEAGILASLPPSAKLIAWDGQASAATGIGSIWSEATRLDEGFVAEFNAYYYGVANGPEPADGMTFSVWETERTATALPLGASGGALGYDTNSHGVLVGDRVRSFSVEIDTWDNGHIFSDPVGRGSNAGGLDAYHMGLNFHQDGQSAQNNVERGVSLDPIFAASATTPTYYLNVSVHYDPQPVPSAPSLSEITVFAWRFEVASRKPAGPPREVLRAYGPRLRGDLLLGFTAGTGGRTANMVISDYEVRRARFGPEGVRVYPADYNGDSRLDLSDSVALLSYLFLGGDPPPCGRDVQATTAIGRSNLAIIDSNGDGNVDLSDAVRVLTFLFLGGAPPVPLAAADGQGCIVVEQCTSNCP